MLAESFQHEAKKSFEYRPTLNSFFPKTGGPFSPATKEDPATKKLLLAKGHPQLTPDREADKCSSVNSIYEMQFNQSNVLKPNILNKSGCLGDRLNNLFTNYGDRGGVISRATSAFKSPNQSALVKQR